MEDKEELLEAIDNYDIFTKAQRKILKVLIKVEVDYKSVISIARIAQVTELSTAAVYQSIELFKKDHLIEIVASSNNKMNSFILNKSRFNEIKKIVENTKNL